VRVLVVDDEAPARDELAYLLRRDPRIREVATASSGTDALRVLQESEVDAIFLDIAMPALSGLDLAGVLARFQQPPAIVFVTAHAQHAVDAFELHAVDYLLKPVREARLAESVRRITDSNATQPELAPDDTIAVELAGVTRLIHRTEVRYVEAQGDYSRLNTATGSHLVRIPISALEERWRSAGFVRIHRSTLVALAHVQQFRDDDGRLSVLVAGRELPASRRLAPAVRDQLRRTRLS
jgi:DNA-binding LytR/AlgR family response regulator